MLSFLVVMPLIHQFGCVGSYAFIAGCSALNKDVPPYVMAAGHYAKPFGINAEGLRRNGFTIKKLLRSVKPIVFCIAKAYH